MVLWDVESDSAATGPKAKDNPHEANNSNNFQMSNTSRNYHQEKLGQPRSTEYPPPSSALPSLLRAGPGSHCPWTITWVLYLFFFFLFFNSPNYSPLLCGVDHETFFFSSSLSGTGWPGMASEWRGFTQEFIICSGCQKSSYTLHEGWRYQKAKCSFNWNTRRWRNKGQLNTWNGISPRNPATWLDGNVKQYPTI